MEFFVSKILSLPSHKMLYYWDCTFLQLSFLPHHVLQSNFQEWKYIATRKKYSILKALS